MKIMKSIAKVNRKSVDNEVFEHFVKRHNTTSTGSMTAANGDGGGVGEEGTKEPSLTIIDLFKYSHMRSITILLCIMWMSTTFVFDGHARNAGSIGSNLFVAHTIGSFTEFPADIFLVLILDKWGRRWPCAAALILGGTFSLVATVVPFGE